MNHQHIPSAAERQALLSAKEFGSSELRVRDEEIIDLRARITELESALAAQPVKVEPGPMHGFPGDEEMEAYALAAIQPAAPQEPLSNARIREIMHNYSHMVQSGYYSDTEFDCLQDVIGFVRECIELSRPTAPDAAAVRDTKRLDFIERNSVCKYNSAGINWQLGQYDLPGRYLTLREAIDAALAASPAAVRAMGEPE